MNRLVKILGAFMPNCREALRLQSDALEHPLSPGQRVGLRIHLWFCVWCRRYGRQIRWLREFAKHCDHGETTTQTLPPATRTRIKHALKTNGN